MAALPPIKKLAHKPITFHRKTGQFAEPTAGLVLKPQQAAAMLNMSSKTLIGHAKAGNIDCINIGTGKRKIRCFTHDQVRDFIKKQTVKESGECQSSNVPALKPTASTFKSGTVDFLAIPKPGTAKTPKPSNAN